ncbi:putative molybdenum carrier protein [Legionella lytica]|uniref:Molybdenum carrier protein n=1 Tax=Legionella lytica TaxID=96232 RepID=A0ABW8D651_9GAMM
MLEKIVSGGQTGVDRAALDVAYNSHLVFGGWCPKGRIDELGIIPNKYGQLVEHQIDISTDKENYDARTKLNIRDSDGTLIILPTLPLPEKIKDGTLLTIKSVASQKKPYLIINLSFSIEENKIHILNIAGPRESSCEGIYEASYAFLSKLLPELGINI